MFLSPTTPHEINSLILNLKLKRMNDEDDIPPFFLRIAKNILSFPLAVMINHSFSLGIFPKILNTAKVLPIFKKGNAKIPRIIAQSPFFLLFQKFTNVQFIIELFYFLIAIISLLPINSVLVHDAPNLAPNQLVIPQITPSLI